MPAKPSGQIVSLSLVAFFLNIGLSAIIPALPLYARNLGASDTMIGGLIAGFAAARLVVDVPTGLFTKMVDAKRLMQIGLSLVASSTFVAGLAGSYPILLAMRLLEGVGVGMATVASIVLLAAALPIYKRGFAIGLFNTMILAASILGPIIGGVVSSSLGPNFAFLLYSFTSLSALVFAEFAVKSAEVLDLRFDGKMPRFMLKDRSFLAVNVVTFSFAFMYAGLFLTTIPLYAYDNLEYSVEIVGALYGVIAVANMGSALLSGILTDRLGRKAPILVSHFSAALILAVSPYTYSALYFSSMVVAASFAAGFWGQTSSWASDLFERRKLGAALGLNRMAGDLGFLVGPLTLGYVTEATRTPLVSPIPFILTAFLMATATIQALRAADPLRSYRAFTQDKT